MKQDGTGLGEPFVKLQDPSTKIHQDIFGITIDPDFSTNHYVYAYGTFIESTTGYIFGRVMSFTELENKAIDQKILVDDIPVEKGRIYAGALAFGPDNRAALHAGHKIRITGLLLSQVDEFTSYMVYNRGNK